MNKFLEGLLDEIHTLLGDVVPEQTQELWGPSFTVDSLPATKELELWLSMSQFSEKERIYSFKSYTDLE